VKSAQLTPPTVPVVGVDEMSCDVEVVARTVSRPRLAVHHGGRRVFGVFEFGRDDVELLFAFVPRRLQGGDDDRAGADALVELEGVERVHPVVGMVSISAIIPKLVFSAYSIGY
jgi:hypothetical protein